MKVLKELFPVAKGRMNLSLSMADEEGGLICYDAKEFVRHLLTVTFTESEAFAAGTVSPGNGF